MHGHYPLLTLSSIFVLFQGGLMSFSVIPPLNANTHKLGHSLLIDTVTSRWLGAVTALCLVGSCRHFEPTGLRIL